MSVRLVASDLDGTLVRSDGKSTCTMTSTASNADMPHSRRGPRLISASTSKIRISRATR